MTRRLLLLNGLAAMMIPIHHSTAFGIQALFQWVDRYRAVTAPNFDQIGSLSYYGLMFLRQADAFAIPTFLFVSGFFVAFMARGQKENVSLAEVLPRIRVLLIPFALWTVVRFAMLQRLPASVMDVLNQYYYLTLLVQLYLVAPLLVPLAKNNWPALLLVSGVFKLGAEGVEFMNAIGVESELLTVIGAYNPRWLFVSKLFSFSLGLVIGLHLDSAKAWLIRNRRWLVAGVVISLSLTMIEYELLATWSGKAWLGPNNPGIFRIIYATLFAPALLAFDGFGLPQERRLANIGSKSLGIYLGNIPFGYTTAVLMYHFTPQVLGIQLIYQAVLIAVGFLGPLLLMSFVRRTPFRRYYRFVFG